MRLFTFVLVVLLSLLSLTACGGSAKQSIEPDPVPEVAAEAEATEEAMEETAEGSVKEAIAEAEAEEEIGRTVVRLHLAMCRRLALHGHRQGSGSATETAQRGHRFTLYPRSIASHSRISGRAAESEHGAEARVCDQGSFTAAERSTYPAVK